ncbi:DUF4402 domain-containing protein [Qipengyuania sp. GH38]|uniref:DUF4402 domain-containing protein n=1 Tax=Qipengyuania intermedia TaxID=2867244 RepID=UPI001C869DA9|nr:DUF4402 domain-containing protein [Qipengyuania intermedia]MBX7514521.1 DUF4402 domain-containing protein [Qipengyuania intermedia]
MKKIILAAAAVAFATPAMAAPGDTAQDSGTAVAEIVAPIAITHDGGALDFGIIIPATTAGTVVVTQGGAGSVTGDTLFVSGSTNAADSFTVTGDAGRAYSIVTTGGSVTSGGNSMTFTTDAPASGTLSATGSDNFSVGGTLNVGANQAAGSYSGSYDATVSYN